MGNQASSCNPGSACNARLHTAFQPCAVAKVLLLDGQVLHFTRSVKAIHVLLQHPNHCLCPAQSLRLTHDSSTDSSPPLIPCSLLPDDQLELGRIYILLPFHTFRLFVSAAASNHHHNTINRPHIGHSLPLPARFHYAPKSSNSRRSSPWLNEEEPTSIEEEEPTSNPVQPTLIQAQPISTQAEPTSSEAQITSSDNGVPTLNHILFCRKPPSCINEEGPTSQKEQPSANQEKTTSNQALPPQNHLVFRRRSPLWINTEQTANSIQEQQATSCKKERLTSNQTGDPSTYRTLISKPSINTALRKANLSSLPASTTSRRSFELQRPHRGVIDIRRCRSWRPRLQAITEMSTW